MRLFIDAGGAYVGGRITYDALSQALRDMLSEMAQVSPTRITDIEVYEAKPKQNTNLEVWFVLHAKLKPDVGENVCSSHVVY